MIYPDLILGGENLMEMQTIYHNLTAVDIEEQRRLWNERGKGYYGEYLLLTALYQEIHGQCKILMNLNIPAGNGKTTEVDLVMLHESGIYVFEAKHYKGTIYGRYEDSTWTQYFRTQLNSHFPSPIRQNEYHIAALKRLFPEIPIYSFIVFTNEDIDVRVTGWENTGIIVCSLRNIGWHIDRINQLPTGCLSPEQINSLFDTLSIYSPTAKETVSEEGRIIPFTDYINQIKVDYAEAISDCQQIERKRYKRKVGIISIIALIVCGIMLIGTLFYASDAQRKAQDAQQAQVTAEKNLEVFSRKFKQVEPLNGGNVQLADNFLEVYDEVFEQSKDLKDTVLFSCKIKINGAEYGVHLNKNTAIIVQMCDGTVNEYRLGDVSSLYDSIAGPFSPWYSNTAELPTIQIYTASLDDIAYIKLSNVPIITQSNVWKSVLPEAEFELYSGHR